MLGCDRLDSVAAYVERALVPRGGQARQPAPRSEEKLLGGRPEAERTRKGLRDPIVVRPQHVHDVVGNQGRTAKREGARQRRLSGAVRTGEHQRAIADGDGARMQDECASEAEHE